VLLSAEWSALTSHLNLPPPLLPPSPHPRHTLRNHSLPQHFLLNRAPRTTSPPPNSKTPTPSKVVRFHAQPRGHCSIAKMSITLRPEKLRPDRRHPLHRSPLPQCRAATVMTHPRRQANTQTPRSADTPLTTRPCLHRYASTTGNTDAHSTDRLRKAQFRFRQLGDGNDVRGAVPAAPQAQCSPGISRWVLLSSLLHTMAA